MQSWTPPYVHEQRVKFTGSTTVLLVLFFSFAKQHTKLKNIDENDEQKMNNIFQEDDDNCTLVLPRTQLSSLALCSMMTAFSLLPSGI